MPCYLEELDSLCFDRVVQHVRNIKDLVELSKVRHINKSVIKKTINKHGSLEDLVEIIDDITDQNLYDSVQLKSLVDFMIAQNRFDKDACEDDYPKWIYLKIVDSRWNKFHNRCYM